jgi:hypothetical protein
MTTTHDTGRRRSENSLTDTRGTRACRVWRILGAALLGVVYWTLVRPRMLNWGARPAEVAAPMPGDELLPVPDGQSTMAVDIDAPPGAVWPWLRQLGQDRGGFYSHEWAENLVGLDIHNADRIVPEWQRLDVGETVRLGRADRFPDATLEVAALDSERSLVLRTPDDPTWWVWSFALVPAGERTRLLVRSRIRLPGNPLVRVAAQAVLDPVTFVMTHGMLRGIESRAERLAGRQAASAGLESDPNN